MPVAVDWQVFALFPALECAHVPFEISGDFLPGVEVVVIGGVRRERLRNRRSFAHTTSLPPVATFYAPSAAATTEFNQETTKCDIRRQCGCVAFCRLPRAEDAD
jgi:hypothetical protein